jgi:translation initiation factor RLI1
MDLTIRGLSGGEIQNVTIPLALSFIVKGAIPM